MTFAGDERAEDHRDEHPAFGVVRAAEVHALGVGVEPLVGERVVEEHPGVLSQQPGGCVDGEEGDEHLGSDGEIVAESLPDRDLYPHALERGQRRRHGAEHEDQRQQRRARRKRDDQHRQGVGDQLDTMVASHSTPIRPAQPSRNSTTCCGQWAPSARAPSANSRLTARTPSP